MSDILIREEHGDFITQLLNMIQQGYRDEAIETIAEIDVSYRQLEILEQIALSAGEMTPKFQFELGVAATVARARDRMRDRAIDLTHALAYDPARTIDLARHLIRARNRAFALASDFDTSRARDLARDLGLILDVARSLATSLDVELAQNINRDLALAENLGVALAVASDYVSNATFLVHIAEMLIFLYSNSEVPSTIRQSIESGYYQKLADSLDECLYLQQQNPSNTLETVSQVLQRLIGDNLRHITLEGVTAITPDTLANTIAPYLQALNDFLRIHAQITNNDFQELRIVQIHNLLPKIEFKAIRAAIQELIESIQHGITMLNKEWRDAFLHASVASQKAQQLEAEIFTLKRKVV
jgi:hypothetical protein